MARACALNFISFHSQFEMIDDEWLSGQPWAAPGTSSWSVPLPMDNGTDWRTWRGGNPGRWPGLNPGPSCRPVLSTGSLCRPKGKVRRCCWTPGFLHVEISVRTYFSNSVSTYWPSVPAQHLQLQLLSAWSRLQHYQYYGYFKNCYYFYWFLYCTTKIKTD